MTTQIAIRLPDDMVAFLDDAVSRGDAANRTALVIDSIERERRHLAAIRDAGILHIKGAQDDLDELVNWTADNFSTSD